MKDITTDEVDNDEDCTFPDDEMSQLTLLTLPPELLLNIISYLGARFVVHRLSLVCKELHQLISDDATWKIRISKRWPNQYPIIPGKYILLKMGKLAKPDSYFIICYRAQTLFWTVGPRRVNSRPGPNSAA